MPYAAFALFHLQQPDSVGPEPDVCAHAAGGQMGQRAFGDGSMDKKSLKAGQLLNTDAPLYLSMPVHAGLHTAASNSTERHSHLSAQGKQVLVWDA